MHRTRYALAALLLAGICIPVVAAAQTASHAKSHHMTAAMRAKEAACEKQADAQKLHFMARLRFLRTCTRAK